MSAGSRTGSASLRRSSAHSSSTPRWPGRASTRGTRAARPRSLARNRYPDAPNNIGVKTALGGPEQVFRVHSSGWVANFGVAVLSNAPGVTLTPRIVYARARAPRGRTHRPPDHAQPVPARLLRAGARGLGLRWALPATTTSCSNRTPTGNRPGKLNVPLLGQRPNAAGRRPRQPHRDRSGRAPALGEGPRLPVESRSRDPARHRRREASRGPRQRRRAGRSSPSRAARGARTWVMLVVSYVQESKNNEKTGPTSRTRRPSARPSASATCLDRLWTAE